MEDNIECLQCK